jgi:hypothetical protein
MGQCSAPVAPKLDYEFDAIRLTDKELDVFRKLFDGMAAKREGKLPVDVLLSVLEMEESPIARIFFSMYDGGHNNHKRTAFKTNGKLNFKQFVLILWLYCAMTIKTCGCLLFELYDKECKGTLITDDIVILLSDLRVPKEKIKRYR